MKRKRENETTAAEERGANKQGKKLTETGRFFYARRPKTDSVIQWLDLDVSRILGTR